MTDETPRATWGDLTEEQPEATKTAIETMPEELLSKEQAFFLNHGFIVLTDLIPHDLLDAYAASREEGLPKDRSAKDNFWAGWSGPTAYAVNQPLLNLATDPGLLRAMAHLIGDVMGLHLTLTGWVSTERNWHQDCYLNPDYVGSNYCAAWIALDDVDPDAGPFEFVDGSHKWPTLRRSKLFQKIDPEIARGPHWPTITQGLVAGACYAEMERRNAKISKFIPKKGDVLIWHSNLVHRGSEPKNPQLLRKAVICHYSGVRRRLDMEKMRRNPVNGSLYFDLPYSDP